MREPFLKNITNSHCVKVKIMVSPVEYLSKQLQLWGRVDGSLIYM